MRIKNILVVQSFVRVFRLLPLKLKRRGSLVLLALMLNSVLDLLGLGVFLPLFSIIGEPNLPTEGWMADYVNFFGFEDYGKYVLSLCAMIFIVIVVKNLVVIRLQRFMADYSFGLANYLSGEILKLKLALGGNVLQNDNSHKSNWEIAVVPGHMANFVVNPLIILINEIMVLGMILVGLMLYNYIVVIILASVLIPIYYFLYSGTKNKISSMEQESATISPRLNALGQLMIFGYSDMMVTNSKAYFTGRFQTVLDRAMHLRSRLHVMRLVPSRIAEIGVILGAISLLLYGAFYSPGKAFITLMGVFALAAYRLLPSSNKIILALMNVKGYQYTIDILEGLKEQFIRSDQEVKEEEQEEITFNKELRIDKVNFHYGDEMTILDDVSLDVQKGEVIGIIGKSGSGKTTLMKILLGFLDAQSGNVLVDGVPLKANNIKSWRSYVGYVAQDVFVMEGSLRENIVFGKNANEVDEALLAHVIEKASLKQLVDDLADGLDTIITENGASLSGGQRQRIGIARAIYSGAKILFFDEATSALDNETEEEINESIRSLMQDDLTILVIAHRYSSLKYCNRIYELSKGVIKRELSYNELI